MGGGFEVEVEKEVTVCVGLALVLVVRGGSSVGRFGGREVGVGGTGAEVAVGCVG